jgi:hypothetical protein
MKPAQFKLCLSITHRLQEHPSTAIFRQPVNPETDPSYSDAVADPVDLGTVESRLKNRDYRSVRQWKQDIKLIWENAIAYYGSRSWPGILAHEGDRLFEKYLRAFSATTLVGWLGRLSDLKLVFDELASHPPVGVQDSCPLDLIASASLDPFTPDDYEFVFAGIKQLPENKDGLRMRKMLKKPKDELDLTKCSLKVLHKAKAFLEERIAKQKAATGIRGSSTVAELTE